MKLKITQRGFENYSGQMGMILFKDGISVNDVPEHEALRLSALFGCTWDTDEQVVITRNPAEMSAPVGRETHLVETDGTLEEVAGNDGADRPTFIEPDFTDAPIKITKRYSLDELEEIADRDGIKGIRAVAGKYGIRGSSINGLIDEILRIAGKDPNIDGLEVVEG